MTFSEEPQNLSTYHLRRRTPGTFLLVPCPQLGRSIRCQGQLEGAAATILAACPRVKMLQEQPFTIWYRWQDSPNGPQIELLPAAPVPGTPREKNRSYIVPDFFVELHDGRKFLLEVKPASRLTDAKVPRKLRVGQIYAQLQDWSFMVLTERELYQGPLLANLQLLNRFRRLSVDREVIARVSALVIGQPRRIADLSNLCSELVASSQIRSILYHLIVTGCLDFDPRTMPLSEESSLFPGGTQP